MFPLATNACRTILLGTELQLRALDELQCDEMKNFCKKLTQLDSNDDGLVSEPAVNFTRTLTIGDLVVLDRACSFNRSNVVHWIQRIDPSEKNADAANMAKTIKKYVESLVSNVKHGLRRFTDDSIRALLLAPFRQLPRPQLILRQSGKAPPPVPKLKLAEPEVIIS